MKKKDLKILKFPNTPANFERQVEAILFAAEEPLDEASIQEKLKSKANLSKILYSLQKQYINRGVNLVCISNKYACSRSPGFLHVLALELLRLSM